jgi:hypothetical protein
MSNGEKSKINQRERETKNTTGSYRNAKGMTTAMASSKHMYSNNTARDAEICTKPKWIASS